jgi:hypothetical protein
VNKENQTMEEAGEWVILLHGLGRFRQSMRKLEQHHAVCDYVLSPEILGAAKNQQTKGRRNDRETSS